MRLILERSDLIPDERDRYIVALLARLHGVKDPGADDERMKALSDADREEVLRLASLLRIADGLDYSHSDAVRGVDVLAADDVTIRVAAECEPLSDIGRATEKGGLFRKTFGRGLVIEWRPI